MFDLNPVVKIYCVKFFHKNKNFSQNKNKIHKNKYQIHKNRTLGKKTGQTPGYFKTQENFALTYAFERNFITNKSM